MSLVTGYSSEDDDTEPTESQPLPSPPGFIFDYPATLIKHDSGYQMNKTSRLSCYFYSEFRLSSSQISSLDRKLQQVNQVIEAHDFTLTPEKLRQVAARQPWYEQYKRSGAYQLEAHHRKINEQLQKLAAKDIAHFNSQLRFVGHVRPTYINNFGNQVPVHVSYSGSERVYEQPPRDALVDFKASVLASIPGKYRAEFGPKLSLLPNLYFSKIYLTLAMRSNANSQAVVDTLLQNKVLKSLGVASELHTSVAVLDVGFSSAGYSALYVELLDELLTGKLGGEEVLAVEIDNVKYKLGNNVTSILFEH